MNISELSINTLKMNGVGAINKANSGHPGIVLGAAKIIYTLFTRHLIYDPKDTNWINRDRFVLSAGHGSALLYAQLRILGLITEDDLKNFRQINSKTPGHPEYRHTQGVEATTGPLGQGVAMGVGMALAQSHLESKFKEITHHTYVLCGDGDLQEGVANEALSFAGRLKLEKLIILHDSNDIQLDSPVFKVFNEDLKTKMEAIGFNYILVQKNEVDLIDKAIIKAKESKKPTFIQIKTIIGDGAPGAGTTKVHGAPLGKGIEELRKHLNWTYSNDFILPKEVLKHYQETLFKRGARAHKEFKESKELESYLNHKKININVKIEKNLATRESSGKIISWLNDNVPQFIGGSADLSGSTKAKGGSGEFDFTNRKGRNLLFGVREFAMGGIANGIALHSKLKVFVSTFFVFSDYLKPSIRLAALMNLPVTYIFTHDSVYVGEDGPTHEPIEHLAMLRSIPNLDVIRPADEKEMLGAWTDAINRDKKPIVILATRQNIVSLSETNKQTKPYYLYKTNSKWTLIATGSEVAPAYNIAKKLNINMISAPNIMNMSLDYDINYAISIEAAATFGWSKFARFNIGIDTFGESGPETKVIKKLKIDQVSIFNKVKKIIR